MHSAVRAEVRDIAFRLIAAARADDRFRLFGALCAAVRAEIAAVLRIAVGAGPCFVGGLIVGRGIVSGLCGCLWGRFRRGLFDLIDGVIVIIDFANNNRSIVGELEIIDAVVGTIEGDNGIAPKINYARLAAIDHSKERAGFVLWVA